MKPILLVLALLSAAPVANASVFDYTYTGLTLTAEDPDILGTYPETLPGYAGSMRIDERLLPGGTLRDTTITFSAEVDDPLPAGLKRFTVFPFPAVAESTFTFSTDADRNIISWDGNFLDGPPDGGISDVRGDSLFISETPGLFYGSPPGTWSAPVPIPLPGTALMLAMACMILAAGKLRSARA